MPQDITFCFLDIETTGLDCYRGDRICEIGLLKRRGLNTVDSYTTLINPGCNVSAGASLVNGITGEMLKGKPMFTEVAGFIEGFINDSVIICHNASFDLGFLTQEFNLAGLPKPRNPVLDTLDIARKYYRFPDNKLKTVANYLGFKEEGIHRASVDVSLTCRIFERFLVDLEKRGINLLEKIIK
ncbi:MAG: 3'-5' exonuclease [Candidatus Omnitrophica bacterium]|nr:3'-5' exonuclease [Candidatus Omnitrophota bacterium]